MIFISISRNESDPFAYPEESIPPPTPPYEVKDEKTGTTLIAVQPLVADQTYMSQMKAMCVPFHMVYGRLMCY